MYRNNLLRVILAVVLVVSFTLSACQSAPSAPAKAEAPKAEAKPASKEPYKVGFSTELTGPAAGAGVGQEIREGLVLEVDRINAAGGVDGHPIEVVIDDNGSDTTKTATSLTKLAREDKVSIILGPLFSPVVGAAVNVAEREQVPLIGPGVMPKDLRALNPKWVFPGPQPDEKAVAAGQLEILKDKGWKKMVTIAVTDPEQTMMYEELNEIAPKAGIQVFTTGDTFGSFDLDVAAQVQKMKALATKEKADVLVLQAWFMGAVTFIKGMKQLNFSLPILGPQTYADYIALRQFADVLEGGMLPSYKLYADQKLADNDPQKPLIVDFNKRFQAKYNKLPGPAAQIGADWILLATRAMKTAGSDRTKIRDALKAMTNETIIGGVVNMSKVNHFTNSSLAVYEIKGGQFQYVRALK